jgi:hypothetical protein
MPGRSTALLAITALTMAGVWSAAPSAFGQSAAPAVVHAGAHAAKPAAPNLIRDPGAERAKPVPSGGRVKVPGWTPARGSQFTAVSYSAGSGFPTSRSPGPKKRGKNFFAGGPSGAVSVGRQTDSLANDRRLIASGKARFALSGWLGGFATQGDRATLTVTWENSAGKALGSARIGPVTQAQRKGVTGMLKRLTTGVVPSGATRVLVTLRMVRSDGAYIDGYADNLSLTIVKK